MPIIWVSMPEIQAYALGNQNKGVYHHREMDGTRTGCLNQGKNA